MDKLLERETMGHRPPIAARCNLGVDYDSDKEPQTFEEAEELEYYRYRSTRAVLCPIVERMALLEATMDANIKAHEAFCKPSKKQTKKTNKKKKASIKIFMALKPEVQAQKKNAPSPRNFQGFSMKNCYYVPSLHRSIYMPPKYYPRGTDFSSIEEHLFCKDCYLAPCILQGRSEDLVDNSVHFQQETADLIKKEEICKPSEIEMRAMVKQSQKEKVNSLMEEIFTKAYARKKGTPKCVVSHLQEQFDGNSPLLFFPAFLESDTSDSDEEEEFV